MAKNTMVARRSSYNETLDDFPTPPWATRALLKYAVPGINLRGKVVKEPACGRGYMARPLEEARATVFPSDVIQYDGLPHLVYDYLDPEEKSSCDYVITNAPFKLAQQFAERAIGEARMGVAIILRTLWIDPGQKRYRFFYEKPPNRVVVYAGRISAAQGKVVRDNGPFMSHSVFWWDAKNPLSRGEDPKLGWIPPGAQEELERDEDYEPGYLK